jgi:hypothetical protein
MEPTALTACEAEPSSERASLSRPALALLVLHPLVTLGSFYSLAAHLHQRLGGWPRQLGEGGFPESLRVHVDIAQLTFTSLLLALFVLCPLGGLAGLLLPQRRRVLSYAGLYALACAAAFGAMKLAPGPFLYWWWD